MKQHRIVSFIMACVFACSLCGAAQAGAPSLRSSPTLSRYSAAASRGSGSGQIVISYTMAANSQANSLGVSSITIYKSNGSYVTAIVASSFTASNSTAHMGTYTYTGVSGTSYYAEVTFFATIGGTTDSQTITTNTVTAP